MEKKKTILMIERVSKITNKMNIKNIFVWKEDDQLISKSINDGFGRKDTKIVTICVIDKK